MRPACWPHNIIAASNKNLAGFKERMSLILEKWRSFLLYRNYYMIEKKEDCRVSRIHGKWQLIPHVIFKRRSLLFSNSIHSDLLP
jgi:hypothetical protein